MEFKVGDRFIPNDHPAWEGNDKYRSLTVKEIKDGKISWIEHPFIQDEPIRIINDLKLYWKKDNSIIIRNRLGIT